ncbi:MAG: glycosyltransferase family 2 protein [Steroidobacteraceae bacterium]
MRPACGIVVIGRNEGQRLLRCLDALRDSGAMCIYVDSGSRDRSVVEARSRGVEVVELDPARPFTAARARNEGFNRMRALAPELRFVQLLDGDCELSPGWLDTACEFLSTREDCGMVVGTRLERHAESSWYNTLLAIEWSAPLGEISFSGGNFMCRVELFERLGGFREDLIAGEDPDFCVRARATGARIWHHEAPMLTHDGSMTRFGQWWRRSRRGGYAFALGYALHGGKPEFHCRRELRGVLLWAGVLPLTAVLGALFIHPSLLLLLLALPLQIVRLALRGTRSPRNNWIYATMVTVGKFPELLGVLEYFYKRLLGRRQQLIEYK